MASYHAADGERLHYWDIGQGPVVLMLHGFGMPSFLWLPFVLPLMGKYRFILPDLRGFGASHRARSSEDSIFTQYAHDLHNLIDHLEIDKPALVGFSMGACTAMEYQRLYGFDNIRSYLQIDQSMHIGHEDEQMHGLFGEQSGPWMKVLQTMVSDMEALGTHRSFWQLPHVHRRRFWKMFSRFSAAAFSNPLLKRFAGLGRHEALVKNVAPVSNWPVYLDCIRTFVEHQVDFRQHMAQLPAGLPVWFFVGDRSEMYPAAGQLNVKKTIPHAQVVRFHKAGHAVMFDSPVRFIRHLDNFLDQTGPRRRARSTHKRASAVSSPLEA